MSARAAFRSLFVTPPPAVGLDIAANRVTGVAIERDGDEMVIARHATVPVPEGVLAPALNAPNVRDPGALSQAIRQVLGPLGRRVRRVVLTIPDVVAKVSVVRFEKVPGRADDLAKLIRWQVHKTVPFRVEEAQLAFCPGAPAPDGSREFLVVLARRDLVEEYERVCQVAGVHAGVIDLTSFGLVNLALAAGVGRNGHDWLLLSATPDYASVAVLRGPHLLLFRNRPAEGGEDLPEFVHHTAMYYEDRLGGTGLSRVIAAGVGDDDAEPVCRALEERLGTTPERIDFSAVARWRDRITARGPIAEAVAPPLGLLLREATCGRTAY